MDRQQGKLLQNFDESKSELLKKRLLKSSSVGGCAQTNAQQSHILNAPRTNSSSMIVSSVQAPQSSVSITHNLVTQSIAPVKIHTNNSPYPIHLSTVHVPVQIPGSTSNINVPVQISAPASSVSFSLGASNINIPVASGTTSVPVQLPPGDTINVPLQLPVSSHNIQLTSAPLPSMPLLHTSPQQLHSSIIHLHMGSNPRPADINADCNSSMHLDPGNVKMNNPNTSQLLNSNSIVQIPNSSNNAIQLTLPNTVNSGSVQLRGAPRTVSHMVYIQTPTGLKPVTSSDVISQASTSGNPPQIIVRRPATTTSNIHVMPNVASKNNIAPKLSTGKSILANSGQPIVIQKSKADKMMVPVTISTGTTGKQTITYLGPVKKAIPKSSESHSVLLPNNQSNNSSNSNQKLHFITPMNAQKMPNTKFILPVSLPATMASKGPIINLQIANGQIQNDPQGNITVMRDSGKVMPPLHPLAKYNGRDGTTVPQSPNSDKSFNVSTAFPGSRAELTGEQEYTLSIPDNSSMNDDIYTVSIEDESQNGDSYTLAMSDKAKSLLNKHSYERGDLTGPVSASAITKRSNSEHIDRKNAHFNMKRRISLCAESLPKNPKLIPHKEESDDHRVPSLFCDEKFEKDFEMKSHCVDTNNEDYKNANSLRMCRRFSQNRDKLTSDTSRVKRSSESLTEDDPHGLLWNNGVGILRGSNLQFQTNEFGLIDVIEHDNPEYYLNHISKFQTPLKERVERGRDKKPTSPEDLYRCGGCGCHGMAAEFITPEYCSITCQNEVHKAIQKKKEQEKAELIRKRHKIKKLMKKHYSETDMLGDNSVNKVSLQRYNTTPPDVALSESTLMKLTEDIGNEKYPWMCGKNGFSWMRYLEYCKAKAAPVKLFKDPFPYNKNGFRVGMRLEAIDPQNPSMFCVVSVAEVQGYRIRLHFDEFSDLYDYWVNADSIDIFPPGYCEKNNRTLQPPKNYTQSNFSWPHYLKHVRAIPAPRHVFLHMRDTIVKPNNFRTGMKLEAEDRKNNLVCVATISDLMDNRLLIHFDSWDEMYDYWVDPASPYIHPVGWAEENGVSLTPPHFYKDPATFSWEEYLSDTGATAAPSRGFKTRPPQGFKEGMKLEVVDKRVPFLIRVATVSAIKGHQVRISYDGWAEEFDVWMDDDSPDIHPVGWCLKTGHPLEPPLSASECEIAGPCGVGGCRGLGSLRGGAHKAHTATALCPYRAPAAVRRAAPRREWPSGASRALPTPRIVNKPVKSNTPSGDAPRESRPRGRPPKHKRIEVIKKEPVSDEDSISQSSEGRRCWRSVEEAVTREPGPAPSRPDPRPVIADINQFISELHLPSIATAWTQEDVAAFVTRLAGATSGEAIAAARLSGCELLMASREELVDCAQLRLGPAIKVYSAIRQLRETVA